MGLVLLKSETFPGDSEAPVMLNWKNRTITPGGGVSVTIKPTRAVPAAGLVSVFEVTEDWLPHPVINRRTAVINRASVAFRSRRCLEESAKM
jgi:hypothetical protein